MNKCERKIEELKKEKVEQVEQTQKVHNEMPSILEAFTELK